MKSRYSDEAISNRDKRRVPKKGKFWCDKCDRNLVRDSEKCSVCGYRNGVRRNKK